MYGSDDRGAPPQSEVVAPSMLSGRSFVLPAKGRRPLAISRPIDNDQEAKHTATEKLGHGTPTSEPLTASESSEAGTSIESEHSKHPNRPASKSETHYLDSDTGTKVPPPSGIPNASKALENNGRTTSSLDIYARKYVPQWLLLVNESPAVPVQAPTIEHIDLGGYRATFSGKDFVNVLPSVEMPHLACCSLDPSDLTIGGYARYWQQRLQNEYAAQSLQNENFGLYNTTIAIQNESAGLYRIRLPGVRESAPRIDLGDILLIRGLLPVLDGAVANLARQWSAHRHGLAPGFSGYEYHAVVWSIIRREETVIVKVAQRIPMGRDARFNIIIPVQAHKCKPSIMSVSLTAATLTSPWSGNQWLRRMLFPEQKHGVLQKELSSGTFEMEWFDKALNIEQKRAIQSVVDARYGQVPFLISGPPGTGKTKTLVEAVLQLLHVQRSPPAHILVCAPSDAAADTLLMRLSSRLQPRDMFRLNSWTRLVSEVPGNVRTFGSVDEGHLHTLPSFETLMKARVVITTCRDANVLLEAGLSNHALSFSTMRILKTISNLDVKSTDLMHWTSLVVDEAAQATEPEILIPLSVVAPLQDDLTRPDASPQLIMAGDEFQLGPRLTASQVSDGANEFDISGLEKSLFQRLFERDLYSAHPLARSRGLPPLTRNMLPVIRPPFANLIRNYRSHAAILTTSSSMFYADTLIAECPAVSHITQTWSGWPQRNGNTWPIMFHSNSGEDRVESVLEGDGTGAGSLTNLEEAKIALTYARQLLTHSSSSAYSVEDALKPDDIIVMSPFRAQVNLLRGIFRDSGLYDVRIGPLEAFQGLESRVVLLCTTRTRLGLQRGSNHEGNATARYVREDKRRSLGVIDMPKVFNVSMTRAQEALIVIGNEQALTSTGDLCWINFLAFCERNTLLAQPLKDLKLQQASKKVGKLETALRYADRYTQMKTHEYMQHMFAERDLDSQMQALFVDDDEEQRIRDEEAEDDY